MPDEEYEDTVSFNTQNAKGWDVCNQRVRDTYGEGTTHPACVTDIDQSDKATLAKVQAEMEADEWVWVQLFGHTILVPVGIGDDVAGILNVGCRAIEDANK